MDDNLKRMLELAGIDSSTTKINTGTKKLDEHIIGGMREIRHVSENPDHYNSDDELNSEEDDTEEDELHDINMIVDDMDAEFSSKGATDDVSELIADIIDAQEGGMSGLKKNYNMGTLMKLPPEYIKRIHRKVVGDDEFLGEYDQEAGIGDDFDLSSGIDDLAMSASEDEVDYDIETDPVDIESDMDGTDVSGQYDIDSHGVEPDVSELIAQIEEIQDMGMSASGRHYDVSKLMNLPSAIIAKIHTRVMGDEQFEESAEYIAGYDDEIETDEVDADSYFPDGAHGQVVGSTGAAGARKGDNPLQKSMRVSESSKELHGKFVEEYRKYLKENKRK